MTDLYLLRAQHYDFSIALNGVSSEMDFSCDSLRSGFSGALEAMQISCHCLLSSSCIYINQPSQHHDPASALLLSCLFSHPDPSDKAPRKTAPYSVIP